MAAGSAPRSAVARFGADERRDAQDRHLRHAARRVRSPPCGAVVVGVVALALGLSTALFGVILRRGADGHEAPARVLVDREHRHHRGRHRPRYPVQGLRQVAAGGDHADRRAVPLRSTTRSSRASCSLPPVPCSTRRARETGGKLGGLIHRMPWVAWLALVGTLAARRNSSAQRLRFGMAAAAGLPVHAEPAAVVRQHARPARRRGARPVGGARRLCDGQSSSASCSSAARGNRSSRTPRTQGRFERWRAPLAGRRSASLLAFCR